MLSTTDALHPSNPLLEELQAAQQQLIELLGTYTEANPLVKSQRAKIAFIEGRLTNNPATAATGDTIDTNAPAISATGENDPVVIRERSPGMCVAVREPELGGAVDAVEGEANLIDRALRVREACRHEGGERPGSHGLAHFPLVGREEEVYAERRKIRAEGLAAGESRTGRVEGVLMERGKEPQAVVGAGRRNDHQLEAVRGALGEPEEPLHEREGTARR